MLFSLFRADDSSPSPQL